MRFTSRSIFWNSSGDSYSKRMASSVSTPPRRNTVVRMKAPAVKALPADAATSRSPEASTITEPMMACRPSFVSQMTPVAGFRHDVV